MDEDSEFQIRSDFPMKQEPEDKGGLVRATIQLNGGGEVITIETMAGDIEVKKAGAEAKPR
jgi:hypothetical protein